MTRKVRMKTNLVGLLLTCMFAAPACAIELDDHSHSQPGGDSQAAIMRLGIDQIDSALSAVATSTGAVARELVLANRAISGVVPEARARWSTHHQSVGATVLFQTWPGNLEPAPAYQSEAPAFYSYSGAPFDEKTFRQLEIFERLTPVVRAAFHSFPYSWSYVTTASGMMLLYPFLTLEEAVNNQFPTQQTFYQHADFHNRTAGWTPPYLDLAGAGMMVTVSTPAYDGDTLLGVVSHDVTLGDLSRSLLESVAGDVAGTAWLVTGRGLVIAVSSPALRQELDEVNRAAGDAVLYYRNPGVPANQVGSKAQFSKTDWINEVTEQVLPRVHAADSRAMVQVSDPQRTAMAIRSNVTGWLLVLSTP